MRFVVVVLLFGWGALFASQPTPSLIANYSIQATEDSEREDYAAEVVVPKHLRTCVEQILSNAHPADEQKAIAARERALQFLMAEYQREGFGAPPGRLMEEFESVLRDTALVIITGPRIPGREPEILGMAAVDHDRGQGTTGERRLLGRTPGFTGIPRSEKAEERFTDFAFRTVGGMWVNTPESLLLSTRKWRIGGPLAVAEVKVLKLSHHIAQFAREMDMRAIDVRSHVLAHLQHLLSVHATQFSAEPIPAEEQRIVTTRAEVDARITQLAPQIEKLFSPYDQDMRERFIAQIYANAADPPRQPFVLVEHLVAEIGDINPLTGEDRFDQALKLFQQHLLFDFIHYRGPDPDVPGMSVGFVESSRVRFDRGDFLGSRANLLRPFPNQLILPGQIAHAVQNPLGVNFQYNLTSGVPLSYLPWINPYSHSRLGPMDDPLALPIPFQYQGN